jgi:SAM-dependent methyltransferase
MPSRRGTMLAAVALCAALIGGPERTDGEWPLVDAPYVATPQPVVEAMLALARVTSDDVVYDLGSGDGRIVITAARTYGAQGIGYDLAPEWVARARANARAAGVGDRVRFEVQDIFTADLREATVVTMYLLPEVNLRLKPRLLGELRPGTRVVSHAFDMGDWAPDEVVNLRGSDGQYTVYYWVVPPRGRTSRPDAQ